MREHHEALGARDADVAAIATAAPFQAAAMAADMPFPLLLDPHFAFRDAIDLRTRFSLRDVLGAESRRNYQRALASGVRQGWVPLRHARNRSAVLIVDPDHRLAWAHEGDAVGDYPPIDVVLEALDELAG